MRGLQVILAILVFGIAAATPESVFASSCSSCASRNGKAFCKEGAGQEGCIVVSDDECDYTGTAACVPYSGSSQNYVPEDVSCLPRKDKPLIKSVIQGIS